MDLKRRQFITLLLAALGATATGLRAAARQLSPARWLQAIRPGRYPGPLRNFTDEDIRRPSRWTG
jgi:hypothetical protein